MGIPGSPNALLMRRAAVSDAAEAYLLKNSLRINYDDTPYLDRNFGTGNRRKWTLAFWAKRGRLGHGVDNKEWVIFSTSCTSTACNAIFQFYNDDSFNLFLGYIGSKRLRTNRKFRDVGSWYHICISFQAGHSDNTERMKLWVNGIEETSFAVDDRSGMTDTDWGISIKQNHRIGNNGNANRSYDGLLSDFHFIDGEFLHPAAFGEFDVTGVWTPKKFAMPTPNTGVTWSGMMTSETGSWYSSSNVNLFNGILGQGSAGQTASASAEDKWIKFTPTGGLKFKQSIRVQHWPGGNSPYLQVKYTLKLTDGREAILEVASSNSSNGFFTLFEGTGTIEYIQQVCSNNQFNNWGALEIDGIMLVDGQTDSATRNNPNDGTKWSDFLTSNSGWYGGGTTYGPANAFDGSPESGNLASTGNNNGVITFAPTTPITIKNKIAFYQTSGGHQGTGPYNYVLDGVTHSYTHDNTAFWLETNDFAGKTISSSTPLTIQRVTSGDNTITYLAGIKVDGHLIVDGKVDNSFRLAFDDTTRKSAIGKDTLNGKISDATGGLPFYNTSGDYGDVKGSGYRTDSSAGTTDGTGLVLALPGDVLTDEHDHINTGSSANTITNNGTVVVSTDESRFYGSSLKFSGSNRLSAASNTDFVLGGGDWCIEFWMRPDDVSGTEILIENDTGTGGISIQKNGDDIEVQMGSLFDPGTTVLAKQWQHVAVTRSGSTTSLFLNGALQGTTSTDAGSSQAGFEIGQRSSGSLGYSGYLQDIRIYKGQAKYTVGFKPPIRGDFEPTNLTETDGVVTKTNADSKPILGTSDDFGKTYSSGYETDSNSSSLVLAISGKTLADNHADVKGSGTNHNISNSSSSTSTARAKFYGTAVETDGGSQHFVVADSSDFEFGSGEFTIEYWINAEDVANDGMASWLMKGTNSSNNSFDWRAYASMDGSNANIYCDFSTSDGNKYLGENVDNMPNDEWVHFAAVRDNTDNKFYIYKNGVKFDDASVASGATMNDNYSDGLTWGYFNAISGSNHYGFDGWVNDIRIYKGFCKYPGGTTFNVVTEGAPADLDVLVDSPTNYVPDGGNESTGGVTRGNYCTLNSFQTADNSGSNTLGECNLYAEGTSSSGAWHKIRSTMAIPKGDSGKWYYEVEILNSGATIGYDIGWDDPFFDTLFAGGMGDNAGTWCYKSNGQKRSGGTSASYGDSYENGNVIGIGYDNGSIYFWKDGTIQNSGTAAYTGVSATLCPTVSLYSESNSVPKISVNFGQRAFKHAQSGYHGYCTQNLPDTFGANSNANEDKNNPSKYFGVLTYTGDGNSGGTDRKGLNFTPDMVWVKSRSDSYDHHLHDQILSAGANGGALYPNLNDDADYGQSAGLTAFINGGFTAKHSVNLNGDSKTYAAWCWDAGTAAGTPISTGNITPNHVWKNRDAGFSITEYTGSGSDNSVPHDLGAKPDLLFVKKANAAGEWRGWHSHLGSGKGIDLNNSSGQFNDDSFTQVPDTNYIYVDGSVGNVNTSNNTYMLYAWTAIKGYSAFGGYDGSNDESFIFTGFQPKWIMIKLYSEDLNHGGWKIIDTNRDPINDGDVRNKLSADTSEQENGNTLIANNEGDVDIISNGFRITDNHAPWNTSGRSYLYAAFAEFPFKTARAR